VVEGQTAGQLDIEDMNSEATLESIRPVQRNRVMDLVDQAGIDVSAWRVKKGGGAVKNPRANPQFCYEWSFGGDGEPMALCVWHKDIYIDPAQDQIYCDDNLLDFATKLEQRGNDPTTSGKVKSRARSQAQRARKFDDQIKQAFNMQRPIRVIVLSGKNGDKTNAGDNTATVKYRHLDASPWHVQSYSDQSGKFRLVRGSNLNKQVKFFDQFTAEESAPRQASLRSSFVRSPEVRSAVLKRAGGVCEFCGAMGFSMANGGMYLETHHVIPLSENGADHPSNVVAICADDHRKAHHSVERDTMRESLLTWLYSLGEQAKSC
jgi:5-methylcytosine-specific restriction protein A